MPDRFRNTYENEFHWCKGTCDRKLHYMQLDSEGYCEQCRLEKEILKPESNPNPFSSTPPSSDSSLPPA